VDHSKNRAFIDAMFALGEAFGRGVTDVTVRAYATALEDIRLADVLRACKRAMVESKWFPKAFELRELAGVLSPEDRAMRAWDAFAVANAKFGFYDTVNFDDPTINATVRSLGGWRYVSTIEDRKEFEVFLRKDFERIYVSHYRNGISAAQAAPLIGEFDNHNGTHGHALHVANGAKQIVTGLPPSKVRITQHREYAPLGVGQLKLKGPEGV